MSELVHYGDPELDGTDGGSVVAGETLALIEREPELWGFALTGWDNHRATHPRLLHVVGFTKFAERDHMERDDRTNPVIRLAMTEWRRRDTARREEIARHEAANTWGDPRLNMRLDGNGERQSWGAAGLTARVVELEGALRHRTTERDQILARLNDHIELVVSLNDIISGHDGVVAGLTARIAGLEAGLSQARGEVCALSDERCRLNAELAEVRERLALASFGGAEGTFTVPGKVTKITALTDESATEPFVIMARLHEEDLAGHVLDDDAGFRRLDVPLSYEDAPTRSPARAWWPGPVREGLDGFAPAVAHQDGEPPGPVKKAAGSFGLGPYAGKTDAELNVMGMRDRRDQSWDSDLRQGTCDSNVNAYRQPYQPPTLTPRHHALIAAAKRVWDRTRKMRRLVPVWPADTAWRNAGPTVQAAVNTDIAGPLTVGPQWIVVSSALSAETIGRWPMPPVDLDAGSAIVTPAPTPPCILADPMDPRAAAMLNPLDRRIP